MQKLDTKLKEITPQYVTETEWKLIIQDSKKDLRKSIERDQKWFLKIKKKYDKFEEQISEVLLDSDDSKRVAKHFIDF